MFAMRMIMTHQAKVILQLRMFEAKDYSKRENIMKLTMKELSINAHLVMECIAESKRRNPRHTASKTSYYGAEPPFRGSVEDCWVFTHDMIIELLNPLMRGCEDTHPHFHDVALTLLYLYKKDYIDCVGNTYHKIYIENCVELDKVFMLPTIYKRTEKGLKWYMGLKNKEKLKEQLETITKKQGES